MNLRAALLQGTKLLEEAHVPVPRLTAEVLLCHALKQEKSFLYAHPERELLEVEWIHYGRYLHERLQGKPTQYITKKQEFYGRDFRVTPDVLIPRPETEHLIETALRLSPGAGRMLDVGTGSGAIAVTLALETRAQVFASDVSLPALAVAGVNAKALGAPVNFLACDLLSGLPDRAFDLVASNPPYVPLGDREALQPEVRDWEPSLALFAGVCGNDIYLRLITDSRRVLVPGGWLLLELGYRSLEAVRAMVASGWENVQTVNDLAGIPRVMACQLTK